MSQVEEKLALSLTAETTALLPFLPYLLQDLWALGSAPKDIIQLLSDHVRVLAKSRVLELACGKGAVAVHVTKTFGCQVKGIDLIPEFIEYARQKAVEYGVAQNCEFVAADINEAIGSEYGYDIVMMLAVELDMLVAPG